MGRGKTGCAPMAPPRGGEADTSGAGGCPSGLGGSGACPLYPGRGTAGSPLGRPTMRAISQHPLPLVSSGPVGRWGRRALRDGRVPGACGRCPGRRASGVSLAGPRPARVAQARAGSGLAGVVRRRCSGVGCVRGVLSRERVAWSVRCRLSGISAAPRPSGWTSFADAALGAYGFVSRSQSMTSVAVQPSGCRAASSWAPVWSVPWVTRGGST